MATITLEEVRTVGGYVVWVLGACWALMWCKAVRVFVRQGSGAQQATVNEAMLYCAAVILVPATGLSPFHLLWMFPLAHIVGQLTIMFPFSVLPLPGRLFGCFCCLGLDSQKVMARTTTVRNFQLHLLSGMPPDEALKTAETLPGAAALDFETIEHEIRKFLVLRAISRHGTEPDGHALSTWDREETASRLRAYLAARNRDDGGQSK